MIDYLKYLVFVLLAVLIFSTFIPIAFNQIQNQEERERREREEEEERKRHEELIAEAARNRDEAARALQEAREAGVQLQANASIAEPCPASAACEPDPRCDPARVGFGVICPDDLKKAQEQGVVPADIVEDIALLGFGNKGQLPVVGSTILLGSDEKLWIQPRELVLVSIVDSDQSIISQSLLPPIVNSQIELPQINECCGKTFEYNLIISRVTIQQLRTVSYTHLTLPTILLV